MPPPAKEPPDLRPDLWLAYRARRGDRTAFGALYDRHSPRVFRLLCRLTGDTEAAEDLTQETFVTAYGSLSGWRGVGALSTWLCGIAVRHWSAARRREGRRPGLSAEPLDADAPVYRPHDDPLAHCTRREAEDALEEAVAALPESCREAFVLIRIEGMRYRQAADLLGVPLGTVQSRLDRAMRLLHTRLSHLIYDAEPNGTSSASPSPAAPAQGASHVVR